MTTVPPRMRPSRRALATVVTASLLALPLAGCGAKEKRTTRGDTEAAYVDVGDLRYQVQISRQLNQYDNEDKAYLRGIDPKERTLGADETWFGVFLRVENETKRTLPAAIDFQISDTQDNVYEPVTLAGSNPFAYAGGKVRAGRILPLIDSAPYNNPSIRGALVLFKVTNLSYNNRPLELTIKSPEVPQQVASIDLDV